jgi:hypothetical protein
MNHRGALENLWTSIRWKLSSPQAYCGLCGKPVPMADDNDRTVGVPVCRSCSELALKTTARIRRA